MFGAPAFERRLSEPSPSLWNKRQRLHNEPLLRFRRQFLPPGENPSPATSITGRGNFVTSSAQKPFAGSREMLRRFHVPKMRAIEERSAFRREKVKRCKSDRGKVRSFKPVALEHRIVFSKAPPFFSELVRANKFSGMTSPSNPVQRWFLREIGLLSSRDPIPPTTRKL